MALASCIFLTEELPSRTGRRMRLLARSLWAFTFRKGCAHKRLSSSLCRLRRCTHPSLATAVGPRRDWGDSQSLLPWLWKTTPLVFVPHGGGLLWSLFLLQARKLSGSPLQAFKNRKPHYLVTYLSRYLLHGSHALIPEGILIVPINYILGVNKGKKRDFGHIQT